jgi:oligopeptide transport system ATP-binding protein
MSRRDAEKRAVELLDQVGIPGATQRVRNYPHEFSGGMRQRAMIAMSLALDPDVLIADEPTTALDVTVQAQIMDLLADIQAERHMGLILITHDLGVVAEVADRIAVMYAGRIVENADVHELYANPATPTRGAAGVDPAAGQQGHRAAGHQGPAAEPDEHPVGLPVPPALPHRRRPLPGGRARRCQVLPGAATPRGRRRACSPRSW